MSNTGTQHMQKSYARNTYRTHRHATHREVVGMYNWPSSGTVPFSGGGEWVTTGIVPVACPIVLSNSKDSETFMWDLARESCYLTPTKSVRGT